MSPEKSATQLEIVRALCDCPQEHLGIHGVPDSSVRARLNKLVSLHDFQRWRPIRTKHFMNTLKIK
jgi:hypothetical protein